MQYSTAAIAVLMCLTSSQLYGAPTITPNGRFIAFESAAQFVAPYEPDMPIGVYVLDRNTNSLDFVGLRPYEHFRREPFNTNPAISPDGRYVAFDDDQGGSIYLYVRDRQTRELHSVFDPGGYSYDASFSNDGRHLVFRLNNTLWEDVYVYEMETRLISLVSLDWKGNPIEIETIDGVEVYPFSWGAAISGDGRFVSFSSDSRKVVPNDTNNTRDVFVHDRQARRTTRVSVNSQGAQGNGRSGGFQTAISTNGRFVAFQSAASNLVAKDTNGVPDIFIHDRAKRSTRRVSLSPTGLQANGASTNPVFSATGNVIAFSSTASNLVAGDTNGVWDVFVHNLETGVTSRASVSASGLQGNGPSAGATVSQAGRFIGFSSIATNLDPHAPPAGQFVLRDTLKGTTKILPTAEPLDPGTP